MSAHTDRVRPSGTQWDTVGHSPQQHEAYTAGLCIDCQHVKYSAGRPRCNECHHLYLLRLAFPDEPGNT